MLRAKHSLKPKWHSKSVGMAQFFIIGLCLLTAAHAQPPEKIIEPAKTLIAAPVSHNGGAETSHQASYAQVLFAALNSGDLNHFRQLLEAGANPNSAMAKSGSTLLMAAESPGMVSILLEHGADPKAKDNNGATALHYAVMRPHALGMLPLLLENGADINAKASGLSRQTPLLAARQLCFDGRNSSRGAEVMCLLAQKGADINATDDKGYTVLISAVVNDNPELVGLMIDLGADTDLKTDEGHTAMDWAQELGFVDIVELLESAQ